MRISFGDTGKRYRLKLANYGREQYEYNNKQSSEMVLILTRSNSYLWPAVRGEKCMSYVVMITSFLALQATESGIDAVVMSCLTNSQDRR